MTACTIRSIRENSCCAMRFRREPVSRGQAGMHVILLVLGLIVTATGAAMIGYGMPISEYGLGNTLIGAGTTAFVGGLILVGLSVAVRELRRIAETLDLRPMTW